MLAAALSAVALAAGGGDWATAAYARGTATLRLHYEMTCGQPGPGPLVLALPLGLRIRTVQVDGVRRPTTFVGRRVMVELPKPPSISCMSIAEGVLRVRLTSIRAAHGTWTIRSTLPRHSFVARLLVAGRLDP